MEEDELPAWMDEAYYKMSKKIAQLTRVIGMLVNKNEEQVPPIPLLLSVGFQDTCCDPLHTHICS